MASRIGIVCKSKIEAVKLLNGLELEGYTWRDLESVKNDTAISSYKTFWDINKENTCYMIFTGSCSMTIYNSNNIPEHIDIFGSEIPVIDFSNDIIERDGWIDLKKTGYCI